MINTKRCKKKMIWFENCGEVFETEDLATSDEEANEYEEESYVKENHNNNTDETQNTLSGKKRRFDELDLLCYEAMPEKTTEHVVDDFY